MAVNSSHGRRWASQDIVNVIRQWHAEHGELPCAEEWQQPGDWPNYKTLCRRFGSFSAAIEAAGFAPRRRGDWRITAFGRRPQFTARSIARWQRSCADRTVGGLEEAWQRALLEPELYEIVADQILDSASAIQFPQTFRVGADLPLRETHLDIDLAEPPIDDWLPDTIDLRREIDSWEAEG